VEVTTVTGRRSIEVPGLHHGTQPIPTASRVGPLLVSGGISGIDRSSGVLPDDPADQVAHLFANAAAVLEAAGGSLDDLAKLTVYVASKEVRPVLNAHWTRLFPDAGSRPARHVLVYDSLPPGMQVQAELIAWVDPS
jgi:2-iminobutanoate/2-iminopropanoate deaminase